MSSLLRDASIGSNLINLVVVKLQLLTIDPVSTVFLHCIVLRPNVCSFLVLAKVFLNKFLNALYLIFFSCKGVSIKNVYTLGERKELRVIWTKVDRVREL